MPSAFTFLASFQWLSLNLVEESLASCADKLEDCMRFIGKGPLGGGCESHAEYMREMCASSCGFCSSDGGASSATLTLEQLSLPGSMSRLDVRKISAKGMRQWHFFELPVPALGNDTCAASGACQEDSQLVTHIMAAHFYDSLGHDLNSSIYRWHSGTEGFVEHQALRTVGAWDLSSFRIEGTWYLAIANYNNGSTRRLNSTVYRWNVQLDAFEFHQSLPTVGAMDVEFVSIREQSLLVFTGNNGDGRRDAASECAIYRWDLETGLFLRFQILETSGGYDAEAFIAEDGSGILVVVHELQTDVYRASFEDLLSEQNGFTLIQSLPIPYARDAEHCFIDGVHLIALAVYRNEESYHVDSVLYSWRDYKLEVLQQFPAGLGAIDAEHLNLSGSLEIDQGGANEGGQFLLMASQQDGLTRLYHLSSTPEETKAQEVENSSWVTPRVYDVTWHYARDAKCYLVGVARFGD